MSMDKDLETKLTAILTEYAKNLANKIIEIENLWAKLEADWQPDIAKEFYNKIHGLQGSAGVFGYAELSTTGKAIEKICNDIFKQNIATAEHKAEIKTLLGTLKSASTLTPSVKITLPKPESKSENANNLIFIVDIINRVDTSNLEWANEIGKSLNIFGYKTQHFMNFATLEVALANHSPQVFLFNISFLDKENEENLKIIKEKYLKNSLLLFFANSGDFSLRLKAVRLGGQAFFVKPFTADDILYEINRIMSINNNIYRVLIIDDEIEIANYHALLLNKAGINTQVITDIEAVDKVLHEFKPDLILTDYYMPNCNGEELAGIIRQQRIYEFIPIVFLSSEENKSKQLRVMGTAADDFLTKNMEAEYLIKTIKNKAYRYKILKSLTTKDNLTMAFNPDSTLLQLQNALNETKQNKVPLSLAMIEVNNFQKIIKDFGNSAGDEVLKNLALMLRTHTKVSDILGRYSDNKFLLICPNTSLEDIQQQINELQKHFKAITYFYKNQIFNATFHGGIATYFSNASSEELIKQAEQNLHQDGHSNPKVYP